MRHRRTLLLCCVLVVVIVAGGIWWVDAADQGGSGNVEALADSNGAAGTQPAQRTPSDGGKLPASTPQSPDASADVAPVSETSGPALPSSPAARATAPELTPAAARALMLERMREQDCQLARHLGANGYRAQREWPWLPPERTEQERKAVAQAVARLSAGCLPAPVDDAERKRRHQQDRAILDSALRAGDLYARLGEGPRGHKNMEEFIAAARATLYDAALSGDPEAISRMAQLASLAHSGHQSTPADFANPFDLWPLVACDLGLDCGPSSRVLDRACFQFGSGCGYDSLEALIRDRTVDWQYQLLDQRRREIVARIRSGQVAGMFDPPPQPTAPPDGG